MQTTSLMEFIQVAYCVTIPLILLLTWFGKKHSRGFSKNLLAVSNLLLIGHSIFLTRQLMGFYFLVKQYGELPTKPEPIDAAGVRLLLLMILPFFSLIGPVRRNGLFTLVMLVLLYWHHPVFTWNTFDLFTKIAVYFCLLCSGYALLWLLKKLPYQSS